MRIRTHVIISGLVQGVCFRMYTRDEAQRLDLTGWVRNRPDGTVEVIVEGERDHVDAFIAWCHHGPSHAQVTNVTKQALPATGEFLDFRIAR